MCLLRLPEKEKRYQSWPTYWKTNFSLSSRKKNLSPQEFALRRNKGYKLGCDAFMLSCFRQNVFLQSVIYSTKKTIILAWGKSRVFSTDPPFLHRRDNNDCRPLSGTWRTLCMNKHLINKAVGRTQKTSFPLSSISKASLCSDSKTDPSSCASKSRQSTSVILQRKL